MKYMIDGSLGNVSGGVLISEVVYQTKRREYKRGEQNKQTSVKAQVSRNI